MNNKPSRPSLNRRDFLKLAAAVGVTAVGGHLLDTYAPWLDYDQQASQALRPFGKDLTMSEQTRELVRYATLAASGHNTQPWKFLIKENAIQIHPDYTRHLPAVDPHDRELWISLGCALENLLVSARAIGYAPEVIYPAKADFIDVRLAPDSPQSSPLFDAIPLRQNTRSEYDRQPVASHDLDQIQALPLEPGVVLKVITGTAGLATVLDYVNQGNLNQFADKAFVGELIDWLRFNKKEAMTSLDGLYSRCTGNPEAPRWLGKLFVSGMKPQQQADIDAKRLRSSAGVIVIASELDDKASWVRTGQVYERIALKMASLDVKSAFLNQPIEVADLRPQFQGAVGLGNSLSQLLVRFGHAEAMPRSLRRPVDQVLVQ